MTGVGLVSHFSDAVRRAMGKRKRKRERKKYEKRRAALLSTLTRFEPQSLLGLLSAAASSPTCRHRVPSISLLIDTVLRNPPGGSERAVAPDLPGLVAAAIQFEPRLTTLEDYVPLDPREKVVTRLGDSTYRLFPGARERPVADVIRSKQIASVIDADLISQLGFGLDDLIELIARYTDHAIAELERHWSPVTINSTDEPVSVTETEIEALTRLPGIETFVEQCRNPTHVLEALKWTTAEMEGLHFDPSDGNSSWGATVAVRLSDGLWTFPLPFLADALAGATSRLADTSLRLNQELDAAHVSFAEGLVLRNLDRWSRVMPHPNIESLGDINAIASWGEKHVLVVDVVGSLRFDRMSELIATSVDKLTAIRPGTALSIGDRPLRIPRDCEVVRLVVAAGSAHAMTPTLPGCVTMTLEDFRWIAETADDHADLFFFCREMATQPGMERIFSFETANAWEYWRLNDKGLHRTAGGLSMMIMAHQIDSEWEKYAELGPLEELLAHFQLPPLEDWTDVKPDVQELTVDLINTNERTGWKVSGNPFPLAVQVVSPRLLTADFSWIPSLGDALQFKITHLPRDVGALENVTSAIHPGVSVEFEPVAVNETEWPVRLLRTSGRSLTLGVDSRGPDLELAQPGVLETLLGYHFASGLAEIGVLNRGAASRFLDLWQKTQKSLSIDAYHIPQRVQHPGEPLKTHISIRSEVVRKLAERLKTQGVNPGRLLGKAAVAFENEHVYPVLKQLLQDAWSPFTPEALMDVAMQELERASAKREHDRQQLYFNVTRMPVVFDPVTRSMKLQEEASRLTRAITTILELVLREPPAGQGAPDDIDWRTLITISDLMLESALRSEASHYGVTAVETEVSDLFEIKSRVNSRDSGFDAEEMQRGISEHQLAQSQADRPEPPVRPGQGLLAVLPELTGIDAAFKLDFGFGLEVFLRVFTTLAGIEVTPQTLVTKGSPDDLAEWCSSVSGDQVVEIKAALNLLTLTSEDLRASEFEPWAFRERDVRLATRPIPHDLSSPLVYIMPWLIKQSFDVYERYLRGGRIPWKDIGTGELKKALEQYRSDRNRELEDDVAALVSDEGLPYKVRVKKASVLGLSSLYGEIDVIVADETRRILWVLEVKDLAESFSVAEISRAIRAFFDPDAFLSKLDRKVEDVRRDIDAAVTKMLGHPENDWKVRGAVVTRRPVPAAFVQPSPYTFVTTRDLTKLIGEAT